MLKVPNNNTVLFIKRSFSIDTTKCDKWKLPKLQVRRLETSKEAHSRLLSDKNTVYILETHLFHPNKRQLYLDVSKQKWEWIKRESQQVNLIGAWTVLSGDDLDQGLYLWQVPNGYPELQHYYETTQSNKEWRILEDAHLKVLRSRHLQYLWAFNYWPKAELRSTTNEENNIYEIRSYRLQPGTLLEWGNQWARAIEFRRAHNEAFGGFFTQIGDLNQVQHFWCYPNLNERKECREGIWCNPGWDQCVATTVPLVYQMDSKILTPTNFSPTQ